MEIATLIGGSTPGRDPTYSYSTCPPSSSPFWRCEKQRCSWLAGALCLSAVPPGRRVRQSGMPPKKSKKQKQKEKEEELGVPAPSR
eukprot:2532128-Prymnesium_polylepis.2